MPCSLATRYLDVKLIGLGADRPPAGTIELNGGGPAPLSLADFRRRPEYWVAVEIAFIEDEPAAQGQRK